MRLKDLAAIAAVALLIILPLAFYPMQAQQSWWIDVSWLEQFAGQLSEGRLYPRWLPDSHGGSGAPVFYYYAPLGFYIGSIPVLLGVPVYSSVVLAFGIVSFGMGLTMYRFLKDHPHRLAGAVVFMILPYTLANFYSRAALGEFTATLFIPLVAAAIRDRRPVALALSYAGMIYSHLPLSLLVSLFFIAPYALYIVHREREGFWTLVKGGIIGLLLASPYLFTALGLQEYSRLGELYRREMYHAHRWLLFEENLWDTPFGPTLFAIMMMTTLSALLLWRARPWAPFALAIILLATLGYGLWSIPLLAKVQFPWRLMPIAGFALAVAFATTTNRKWAWTAMAPALAAAVVMPMLLQHKPVTYDRWLDPRFEVGEYTPPGIEPGELSPSQWALTQDRVFYFPSLGTSSDGIFLDGEPELRTLPIEKAGYAAALVGLLLLLLEWRGMLSWRRTRTREKALASP